MKHKEAKELREEIVEYRKQGHYIRECCERFNVKKSYVYSACRGIDYPWIVDTDTMSQAAKKQAEDRNVDPNTIINLLAKRNPMFEYVGGYTKSGGCADIKCKVCGHILTRSYCSIKQGSVRCDNCEAIERERKQRKRETEKEKEKENRRRERELNKKTKQMRIGICPVCNSAFLVANIKHIYCSDVCGKRATNAVKKDRRIRRIHNAVKDKGITLERLYEVNNGVCALCGCVCDWNDYSIRDDGTFIAKDNYPSIDHVQPISKGGVHAWSNVQLAHRKCNIKKGATI